MTGLRTWLIASAILLAAASWRVLAVEPDRADSAAITFGAIPAHGDSIRFSGKDLAPALSRHRMELGWGLHHDSFVSGFDSWYGVYLQSLDRVAEHNTLYGRLVDGRGPRLIDGKPAPAFCCGRVDTVAALEQHPSAGTARRASPTILVFANVAKKKKRRGLNFAFDGGWKLQAGSRKEEYTSAYRTRVGYLTVERSWESFRTAYSFQLERAGGWNVAPSHALQFDYLYRPGDSIGISFTGGRRIANFGPLGIKSAKAQGVTLRGQHTFRETWALTFEAGYHHHEDLPAHKGVRLGIRHTF
jgi:hypothetical protein